jgi:serine/threonine protein kinase
LIFFSWSSVVESLFSSPWLFLGTGIMTKSFERQLLGQMIASKYRIQEIQAAGAFGTVFQAHQYFCQEYVRPVAVKISRQTGLTEETAPVLFSDALMLARLLSSSEYHDGQRHLVQIFDMGLLPEHDHRAYLVMEYVDGQPLLSHLHAAGHLGVATGLRFVRQICRALALVHGQGAVHRDLKADNVLIDRRGVVRVVDFGLATYTDPELGFAPGSMGTFTYMAPETLMGRSTPASDVYSVGLLLYELFTGGGPHLTAPWSSEDRPGKQEEHYRIKTALPFRPPSEVHNEIRFDYRWLDALILRCLEIEPSRRFRDAGQLLAAIEACEAGKELPAVEPETEGTGAGVPVRARENPETVRDALFREVRRLLASRDSPARGVGSHRSGGSPHAASSRSGLPGARRPGRSPGLSGATAGCGERKGATAPRRPRGCLDGSVQVLSRPGSDGPGPRVSGRSAGPDAGLRTRAVACVDWSRLWIFKIAKESGE